MRLRWLRRFHLRQLIRTQAIVLARIKLAAAEEARCIKRAAYWDDPGWFKNARDWQQRRQRHQTKFMALQSRIDELFGETVR